MEGGHRWVQRRETVNVREFLVFSTSLLQYLYLCIAGNKGEYQLIQKYKNTKTDDDVFFTPYPLPTHRERGETTCVQCIIFRRFHNRGRGAKVPGVVCEGRSKLVDI